MSALIEKIKKKKKDLKLQPHHIKSHLFILVNCLIENPTFDSQTKETLTLKHGQFGSEAILSDKFLKEGKIHLIPLSLSTISSLINYSVELWDH